MTFLEQQLPTSLAKNFRKGLVLALILGATLSIALSALFELLIGVSLVAIATVFPLLEEIFKGLSILLVALFVWKTIPSRRYGAILGASTGLGFAISENIIYSVQYALSNASNSAELIASRWVGVPFMHVTWDAFVGIGIFVLLAQKSSRRGTPLWLAMPFLLAGVLAHMLWNSIAVALSGIDVFGVILVDVIVIFIPFAIMLRDFLGGHFNLQGFLKSATEPRAPQILIPPQPPPPPPPP
ncbi:MAG: PrsW family glutamic-type intramembrane protease [Candidatus Bathyarchaeia archaeon]